jgi:predicted short-subunit dehydrogenase-like oxidoreductase (DUF2520 family)
MIKVVIFGTGNVATQLSEAFIKSGNIDLAQVYSRSNVNISFFKKNNIEVINSLDALQKADLYILAISDDAISEFAGKIPIKEVLIAHTSGAVSIDAIKSNRRGVFYPLQTISKQKNINFKKVPICIEANSKDDLILLRDVAKSISKKVYEIDSKQRESLHVAAVFVNNFVNHLYTIAEDICIEKDVPFDILKPLIVETAKKIKTISPVKAQTGPAIRNDVNTIKKHIKMLSKEQQNIYKLMTESIYKKYKKSH